MCSRRSAIAKVSSIGLTSLCPRFAVSRPDRMLTDYHRRVCSAFSPRCVRWRLPSVLDVDQIEAFEEQPLPGAVPAILASSSGASEVRARVISQDAVK
jgi:hypothetical protein